MFAWSAVATAAPNGRVIRVDRGGGPASPPPRICQVHAGEGKCVGAEPRGGQTMLVLDHHQRVAEVQVTDAKRAVPGCENLWNVQVRMVRGRLSDGEKLGVIDDLVNPIRVRLLDPSHLVSPSGESGDEVWNAIDRDGDGTADVMVTRFRCDADGRPVTDPANYCLDIWTRDPAARGAKLVRTTQLNFATCAV